MERSLNIERKSFEIWSDDFEGLGVFSITERAKGRPHIISCDSRFCNWVITFLLKAKDERRDVDFCETFRLNAVSVFLTRDSNERGWFIKITEWQKDHRNLFIVVPTDIGFAGWANMAIILQQMTVAKRKMV